MPIPTALIEFLEAAREIFDAAMDDPVTHQDPEWECAGLEPLERVAAEIGGTTSLAVLDAFRRCGVFRRLARREVIEPGPLWEAVSTRLRSSEIFLGALQLEGLSIESLRLNLGDGFELRRFPENEWRTIQPDEEHEFVAPEVIAAQVFLTRDETRTMPPRDFVYSPRPQPPRTDVLWTQWWRPLLALALFRPEYFRVGVRLELTPGWRLRSNGEFEGDYLPYDVLHEGEPTEKIFKQWGNSIRSDYKVHTPEQENTLTTFVGLTRTAIQRAIDIDGESRLRIAAKRFLSASFHLPGIYASAWNPDEDQVENLLLDLVRAADGLLIGTGGAKERTFVKRATLLRENSGRSELRLTRAYQVRSKIAHGSPPTKLPSLWLLHEDIRYVFLGYLGMIGRYASRKQMIEALDRVGQLPAEVRRLQELAVPTLNRRGHPRRRSA